MYRTETSARLCGKLASPREMIEGLKRCRLRQGYGKHACCYWKERIEVFKIARAEIAIEMMMRGRQSLLLHL
jgi:hypothetical protein